MLSTITTRHFVEVKDFKGCSGKNIIKATNIWQNIREKEKKKVAVIQTCVGRDTAVTTRNQWLVLEMEA